MTCQSQTNSVSKSVWDRSSQEGKKAMVEEIRSKDRSRKSNIWSTKSGNQPFDVLIKTITSDELIL